MLNHEHVLLQYMYKENYKQIQDCVYAYIHTYVYHAQIHCMYSYCCTCTHASTNTCMYLHTLRSIRTIQCSCMHEAVLSVGLRMSQWEVNLWQLKLVPSYARSVPLLLASMPLLATAAACHIFRNRWNRFELFNARWMYLGL